MSSVRFKTFLRLIMNREINDENIMEHFDQEFLLMEFNGLTPLHAAAKKDRASLVSKFIDKGANIDILNKFNYTSLHSAASDGYLEVVKILVEHGANLEVLDRNLLTPLDQASICKNKDVAEYLITRSYQDNLFDIAQKDNKDQFRQLFNNRYNLFIINRKTKLTLYETLLNSKANNIINLIRSKPITTDEMNQFRKLYNENDPGFIKAIEENPLAKFVMTREVLDFEENICVEYANKYTALNFKYPLELAVSYGSRLVVADVQKYLDNENDSIDYVYHHKEETKEKTKKELRNRKKYLKRKYKKKYSRLHVAIMDDCPDMVESLLEKGICNVDEGSDSVGPPIYQCIKLENQDCLNVLLKKGPNMDFVDKNNQYLLHMVIRNNIDIKLDSSIDCITNYQHRDQMGLTALHLAVIKGNKKLINLMVNHDSEWNSELMIDNGMRQSEFSEISYPTVNNEMVEFIKGKLSSRENVVSLNLKIHNDIFECILSKMEEVDVLRSDGDGNNILHLTCIKLLPNLCQQIISKSTECLVKRNNKGNTPLLEMIELAVTMRGNVTSQLIEVVECLVPNRDDVRLDDEFRDGKTILQKAMEAQNERLILTLTKFKPKIEKFSKEDLLFCIEMKFYEFIEEHISRLPKSSVEDAITQSVFMSVLDDAPYQCIKVLYRYSCDNNKDLLIENMLYVIYSRNEDIDYASNIIGKSISSPQLLRNGESILTFMIGKNDIRICEDILNKMNHCDKLVNLTNSAGYLPIHLAVINKQFEFVSSLIPLMKKLDEEDTNGETVLHFLIKKLEESEEEDDKNSIFKIIKLVLSNGGNIYLRSQILGRSPIEECRNLKWKYEIEKISNKIRPQQHEESGTSVEQLNKCTICTTHQIDCILNCAHKFCLNCEFKENRCPFCRRGPTFATRLTFD